MTARPVALSSYENFGADYARVLRDNAYNAHFERPSTLSLLPKDMRGKKVLDAGCGPGAYIEWLLDNGADVTAVDVSPSMVRLAQEKHGTRARIFTHDLARPLDMLEDTSFDLIIAPLVIHYIEDLHPLFAGFYRLLKKGGQMVLSTHHPMIDMEDSPSGDYFRTELLEQVWNTVGRPVTVRFYRRPLSAIISAMTDAGFAIDKYSEGILTPALQKNHPRVYERLTQKPNFIFFRLVKNG